MIIKQDFFYPPAKENRPLHIYLPDEYYSSSERYPVMYFFDGHNLFSDEDATYGKSWGLKDFLDRWDKPMIIVGLECGHGEGQRLSEYLPYPSHMGWLGNCQPLGDATFRWIVNDIKPWVDANFRTWAHREATAIGGSSMGGIMSLYGLVRYNHVFSKGACVSSAIFPVMNALMNDMRECSIHPDTRAWLSWGTVEARCENHIEIDCSSGAWRCNKAAADRFLDRGAMPQLYCQLGGSHCEADWEKQVPLFMDFLWK